VAGVLRLGGHETARRSMHPAIAGSILLLLVTLAVRSDLVSRRIPNRLTIGCFAAGMALRVPLGLSALGWGVTAALLAFVFGFVFYLIGGLGGGDVKLMAGLATFLEPDGLLVGLLAMAGVGGIMAIVTSWRAGRLRSVLTNVRLFVLTAGRDSFKGWKGESPMATLATANANAVTNPYAVAIGVGALAGWIAPLGGWVL
jgi:prepilin peptidase CpaA